MPPLLLCSQSALSSGNTCSPTCWQVSQGFLEDALCRLFKHLMLVISVLRVKLLCSAQCCFFPTVWIVLSHYPFLLLLPEVIIEEKQCLTGSHQINLWKQRNAIKNHRCEKPDWTRQRNVYGFGKAILYRGTKTSVQSESFSKSSFLHLQQTYDLEMSSEKGKGGMNRD